MNGSSWSRMTISPAASASFKGVLEYERITDMANRLCGKLSKGYKQRVGLASTLIHNPDVR